MTAARGVAPQVVAVHVLDDTRHPVCGAPRVDDVWSGDVPTLCVECVVHAITRPEDLRHDAPPTGT